MFRLTREVRFAVPAAGSPPTGLRDGEGDGTNGHAARPPLVGLGHYFELRVTLAGEVGRETGYLRNIKDIDRVVRRDAVPLVADAVADRTFGGGAGVVARLLGRLGGAWPGHRLDAVRLNLSPALSLEARAADQDIENRPERQMVRLSQTFEFAASHRLHNPSLSDEANRDQYGKCNNALGHGHNYVVRVTVAGEPDATGVVVPVADLERVVEAEVIAPFDHKYLNAEVDAFGPAGVNPSVENIAREAYRRLAPHFGPESKSSSGRRARLASVTVWETPKTWCEYSEE